MPLSLADHVAMIEKRGDDIPNPINFYSTEKLFGVFSNFFPSPFVWNKLEIKTTEHLFQALKFYPHSEKDFKEVLDATDCFTVTKIGRDRSRPLRQDWEKVKIGIMFDALTAKFLSHPDLLKILVVFCNGRWIRENTKNDGYWGTNTDSENLEDAAQGRNMLGVCLMSVRDALASLSAEEREAIKKSIAEKGLNPLLEKWCPKEASVGAAMKPPS